MSDFHVFVSYARKDNVPTVGGGVGWVSAFVERLSKQHLSYAGQPLRVFFDTEAIGEDQDWQARIGRGLRTSRLFVAFLSPNYLDSPVCRWEFEEYLRLEHSLARGDEGVKQIYFVAIPGLHEQPLESFGPDKEVLVREIRRRNLSRGQRFELIDWYSEGADLLKELDAEDRLAALRANPQSDRDRKIVSLVDQMEAIDRAIARRLDQAALAELAPGNIAASYANFVGRAKELRDLHRALVQDRIGLVGALHGLGGQGKTALAVQYAYAYAGHYAAGGRWLLPCEGKDNLAEALEPLAGLIGFEIPERADDTAEARALQLQQILGALRARVAAGAAALPDELAARDVHTQAADRPEIEAHMLLVLDNVDRPELLAAAEAAGMAGQDWLQVVMTTRLDPARFGAADERLCLISVDDLPPDDALALLARLRQFKSTEDEAAARRIVALLGGFTLGVELVGAYLAGKPEVTYAGYLARLEAEGLAGADALAKDPSTADRIRHRDKQIGRIVEDTILTLPEAAKEILACAALFPPDQIVVEWLRPVVASRLPDLAQDQVKPGYPDPFQSLMRDLSGRRLLPPSALRNAYRSDLATVRIHRLIADFLKASATEEENTGRLAAIESFCEQAGLYLQGAFSRAPGAVAWMTAPLESLAELRHRERPTASTARALSCLSGPISRLGLFSRGLQLEQAALAIAQRLHAANPDDAQAARDLLVSLNKLGDFFLRRGLPGDADRALQAYEDSLAIAQRLHAANPDDAQAARDLSVFLGSLGDFFLRRGLPGDADRALQAYEDSLAIAQRLHAANPDDAQAARDLSVSLNNLGDFFLRRGLPGDADRALQAYEDSLAIAQRLHAANPDDAQAARDLSVSHFKLAQFFSQRGDEAQLRIHLAACFAILDAFHREGRAMDPDMRRLHAQLAGMFGGAERSGPADEAIDALLANDEAFAQIDATLRASGLEGGLAALSPEQQRDIVRQMLAQSSGRADLGENETANVGPEEEPEPVAAPPEAPTSTAPGILPSPEVIEPSEKKPKRRSAGGAIVGFVLFLIVAALVAYGAITPSGRAAFGELSRTFERVLAK